MVQECYMGIDATVRRCPRLLFRPEATKGEPGWTLAEAACI